MDVPAIWVYLAPVVVATDLLIRFLAILIIPRNRKPSSGTAWLLVVFFVPFLGFLLFLAIGSNRLPKSRREKHKEVNDIIRRFVDGTAASEKGITDVSAPEWLDGVSELNRTLGSLPMTNGNDVALFPHYEEALAEMTRAIDAATKEVDIEFYILALDDTTEPFFLAMRNAVARGVKVRVLTDFWAAWRSVGSKKTFNRLDEIGVEWALMLPVAPFRGEYQRPDLRNHRKLMIVDGVTGFVGSQNVIDSSYNKRKNLKRGLHWVDVMARLEGPVVSALQAVFVSDWYLETGELLAPTGGTLELADRYGEMSCQIVPSGPGFVSENNLQLFLALLYNAQERIMITSPYFVPEESILYAINAATARGVQVELFVSEVGDQFLVHHAQRSYYEALLRAGVRIYRYCAPTILHAKHFTVDDNIAVIGSSNMDMRSFNLNFEVSMLVYSEDFVSELRKIEDDYRERSTLLTLEEWQNQPWFFTILDNLARLTSSLQ